MQPCSRTHVLLCYEHMFRSLDEAPGTAREGRGQLFDWEELQGDAPFASKRKSRGFPVEGRRCSTPGPRQRGPLGASQVLRRTLWALTVGVAAAWMVATILSGQHRGAQAGAVGSAVRDAQTESIGQVKVASEVVYVVQPGDTLWSIAHRLDPAGDERPLVDRLASQLRGTSIYPGETIQIPDH